MSMYSGIGSFVKKYNEGGGAGSGVPGVGGSSGPNLSYEEWLQTPAGQAAADGPRGGQISGLGNPQVMYQAYLAGQGASGGGATNTKSLPSYMSINDAGQIAFVEGTTNRQFVKGLEILGLLDATHSDNKTDYDWLLEWFDEGSQGADGTWLNTFYSNPDRMLDPSDISSNLASQNVRTLTRLYELVNKASEAGGITPSQNVINTYTDPITPGEDYGAENEVRRPVFIGQPPTGGTAEAPSYSLSDVMVTAFEQPNLYDVFNPYPAGGFEQINPYSTPGTTSAPYSAPTGSTPPLVVDSTGADAVAPVVDTTTNTPVVDTTTNTPVVDTTTNTPVVDTTTNTTTTTNTPVVDTTITPTTSSYTPPTPTDEEIAAYKYRTMTPQAFAASGYSLPTAGGVSVADIGGPSFPEGQGYQGYSSTAQGGPALDGAINPDYAAAQQGDTVGGIGNTTGFGKDINWSAPTTQALSVGDVFSTPAGDYRAVDNGYGQIGLVAEGDVAVSNSGDIIYNTSSGDHHFGVDPNTGEAWYQGAQGTNSNTTTGFAEGGIVDVYSGDMSKLQTTGDGIESFLNPERSKATLRRNLAKLAPRPTAPVMQQGIMPMAV